ncbi:Optic atrophy 3-like protein [Beauveria brongniartii RCEF 3172]|uniref:Optic atrophy 3-like protein n=1 Tax=Beauveria brongniartii RCEF 3172 TaxID=1081107 RepID=A0A162HT87_9HYPO|nr:Optic atrophy 3-like protein [Beauveria brongniartii RCEF 3172]
MVPLPLFKLGALFLRHVSKYGANHIKKQAHDHARFRAFAARYGQMMHQLNMRMSVALLRDVEAERRAKEKAQAPTVKTEAQTRREEEKEREKERRKAGGSTSTSTSTSTTTTTTQGTATQGMTQGTTTQGTTAKGTTAAKQPQKPKRQPFQNIWTRKFRALPEEKAVDLFADVIGDTFILGVAVALILYEYWRAQQKPDSNKERIEELARRVEAGDEVLREAEERHRQRLEALETALRSLQDPKTKKPLLPSLQDPKSEKPLSPSLQEAAPTV